ncbi:MAG: hypothetical protein ONB46_08725 [candidate division KSB1 bacterium]|nr:hypothetical protein [candidate division KSB1 bacterium]MDZ7365893.1 hypothetical protein [candidate division KSB1 bacterium]MDZ7403873.1 hypothetical protein [candidate division KSB1 bacterium]
MVANFTSVVLENGLLPIAPEVQKRLDLNPGDHVRINIKVLGRPDKSQASTARYAELLAEKELRILTPKEQAELIALADAEFDAAIARVKKLVQKSHPDLFDEKGRLKKRKALASLRLPAKKGKDETGIKRKRR